jgi:hypothetical protein
MRLMLILVAENDYKAEQTNKHSQSNSLVFPSAQECARTFWIEKVAIRVD